MKPLSAPIRTDREVEQEAADWVTRCDAGLTPVEQRLFQDWLAGDSRRAEQYTRLSAAWSVLDRAQDQGAASAILEGLVGRAERRRRRRRGVGVAAGFGVVLLLGFAWPRQHPAGSPGRTAPAAMASETVRKLPDGSIVELNVGAEIAVRYETAERKVRLVRGEAHFRVEPDPGRPFIVEAGGVAVRAVGTAFTVQLQGAAVEVVVAEGKVVVASEGADQTTAHAEPALVTAGNRVVIAALPAPEAPMAPAVQAMSAAELTERLAWRIPRLEFNGTNLAEAVALMNRHNRLQILLAEPAVGQVRVSGTFRSDNPEGFVRLVEATLGLRAEQRAPHEIVLRQMP
jgi:transmembrane sensor